MWKYGQRWEGGGEGKCSTPTLQYLCTKPLAPVKHPITIQDGSIETLVYLVFCSKTLSVLQAVAVGSNLQSSEIIYVAFTYI